MPELPEVQTVVNNLAPKIIGKIFSLAEIKVAKMVSPKFKVKIRQARIKNVFRRAKMIVMELDDQNFLLVHLKMTGQLIYADQRGRAVGGGHPINSAAMDLTRPNRFTRIILNFENFGRLLFHDVRKFGWMKLVSAHEFEKISQRHGLEPLSPVFTLRNFQAILKKRPRLKIKQFLLAQDLIAGLGNIYVDESLFAAKIRPGRLVKTLMPEEIKNLRLAIVAKLRQAIRLGGTSVNTFVNAEGVRGRFTEKLRVYGRGNERCFVCGSVLQKTKLAGRGTVHCSKCQK